VSATVVVSGLTRYQSQEVKHAFFTAAILAGLATAGSSCRVHKAGPAARGAGYGAGLARQAVTLDGESPTRGAPLTGFPDPANPPEVLPWSDPTPPSSGAPAPAGHSPATAGGGQQR
jgi:hypothetical protein